MVNELPVIEHKGKKYFMDNRLQQIRAVDNPHDFMSFDEWDDDD